MNHRSVGPSSGQPQCSPVDFRYGPGTGSKENQRIPGTFVCGELGTRCVCSAPALKNGVGVWKKNECSISASSAVPCLSASQAQESVQF
ncbi:hypothetical protein AC249_AIPGENE8015 [Exaiptasia diaphana]|nr:hypothetical protein AC249_AIPGENE8015 [Exaiptasia diaphana]